jgi:hypothetical protein
MVALVAAVAVVLVGLLLLAGGGAGDDNSNVDTSGGGPAVREHWHSAIDFYVCDGFVEGPFPDVGRDALGIHSHNDGLIHIHPFVEEGAGANATLDKFLDQIDARITATAFELPDGTEPECEGTVRTAVWESFDDATPRIVTGDPGSIPLRNGQLITVGYVADGVELPQPRSAERLAAPGDL